jgi:penicillin-binding protein 2
VRRDGAPFLEVRVTRWFGNDEKLPHTRLAVFSYAAAALTILLLAGFWKLQVLETGHFADLAERNRIRTIPIMAPRGRILDREGRVLVDNYPSFSILLLRGDSTLLEKSLPQVADGLDLPVDDLRQQLSAAASEPKFQPIVIKPEATQADIAFVESHRADLPVLELLMVHRRRYPSDGFLSHAIGYVGEVSEQQLSDGNGRYRPGDVIGRSGLEREYNDVLMGTDGSRRVMVDSMGRVVSTLDDTEATPGQPIQLSIDYDLQAIAEADLGERQGAIVALDPRTGQVLAMASHPAPDPNDFAVRISAAQWKALNEDPEHPLLNRAIQAQLAPGSVFKIIVATAMLESGTPAQNFTVSCPGYADFYGRTFHCWQKNGHGSVNLHKAIVQSCDVFFYNVGKRLGIDRIYQYATELGLGRRTGIDLPGEQPGFIPSPEWKERVFHQQWYAGETISVAVGQGAVVTTPLQMAYSIGGIAMGGTFVQPHLLKDFPSPHTEHVPLREDTIQQVTDAMFGVVNEGGTAAGARLQNIELCGKTGSAQVIGYDTRDRLGKAAEFKENAWFVGYAPRRNPEIAVAVVIQGGGHGGTVAPEAADIVKAYYQKKQQREQRNQTARNFPSGPQPAPMVATLEPR